MTHDPQPPPSTPDPTSPPAITRLTVWQTPAPDQPGCLTSELAQRLLDEHTQAGQVVIDLDDDPTLPGVAAAIGRGYHALTDLTDPDLIAGHVGRADLVLLRWPRPATNPRHLLQAAHTLLKASGWLAILVHVPALKRAAHLVALTGAAHNAGFHLLRHIVAIASAADDTPDPPIPGRAAYPQTELLVFQPRPPA